MVYSVNQPFQYNSTAVSLNLTNPPLIINFSVTPEIVSRDVWYVNKTGSKAEVTTTITGPSPNAWFEVTVADKTSGNTVLRDGYARIYGIETQRQLKVFKTGLYRIEFSGNDVTVLINMSVKQQGNIVPFP
jgi:hypothetical protein